MKMMRTAVAIVATLLVLSVITACPLLACPLNADYAAAGKSCCHKSHSAPKPCEPTARNCPYDMLERGKTTPVLAHILSVALISTATVVPAPDRDSTAPAFSALSESLPLFLRIRVLRI